MFRALNAPNYRLYFSGQGISLTGSWMQVVAMSWLVYRLTGSAFLLGFVGFSSQFPSFVLGPLAGVMIDRWNKHRTLVTTQTLFMIQAFVMASLVLSGRIEVWHIIVLSVCLGMVNAIDMPLRQSFIVILVGDKNNLGNAIALNSMMFNGARLVGPAIAGIIVAKAGEGICFLINAVSYLAVIAALLAMKHIPKEPGAGRSHVWSDLKEGFGYAFRFVPIRSILSLIALISMMGMSFHVLMPVFAREVLGGDARTLGFLMSAIGVGALFGAVILASRKSALGLEKIIAAAALIFSMGLVLLSFSRTLLLSLGLIAVAGFGMMAYMVSSNTLLQTLVDDNKRGRIMSLYTTAFMGMTPIGSLISGSLAHAIGAPHTVLIGGLICISGSLFFIRKLPEFRKTAEPVFIEKGLIPPVAEGIQSATELTAHAEQCVE
ncbi:MFS transporter [bacterium]|nr:MFS transporter [bacterium]